MEPGGDRFEPAKGERTMSRGFVAQYAAEAAMQTTGVASLEPGGLAGFKEALGVEHEGKGVVVVYHDENEDLVTLHIYPVIWFGSIVPEVAWAVQERVKADVERFTGLSVEAVHVHVVGIRSREEAPT